ncbi:MAG: hypothetical protein ACKO1M_06855, partial [Planctomycetota bacterium]
LREASRWLARLTEGRYHSITTAVDEARLEIHERDGQLWRPERLSRGTREQVFLALRLALVRDLARHDVTLPIVMDDALVNFDDTRARAAARTIMEFLAEQGTDRQMLVFTCHAHVATMFHEAGAHVRSLSDPSITWGRRPEPARLPEPGAPSKPAAMPKPVARPKPEPQPEPLPVVELPPPGDPWPAEAFFFGPQAAETVAHRRTNAPAAKPPRRRPEPPASPIKAPLREQEG